MGCTYEDSWFDSQQGLQVCSSAREALHSEGETDSFPGNIKPLPKLRMNGTVPPLLICLRCVQDNLFSVRPTHMYTYVCLFIWRKNPDLAEAASLFRFLDHAQLDTHTQTPCRTPLNELISRRRGRSLHNTTYKRDDHPCPQRVSNRRFPQSSCHRLVR